MKAFILVIGFLFLFIEINAQYTPNLSGIDKNRNKILLKEILISPGYATDCKAILESNGKNITVKLSELSNYQFDINNLEDFWKWQPIRYDVYQNISKYSLIINEVKDWESESIQFLTELEEKNLIFYDSYLQNYLYTNLYKIYPVSLNDGRLDVVNLKIMIESEPNAFVFPNGTIILTTGLLSVINSEDELIGIMAHEISHYVLAHSKINISRTIQREKNAVFWANFLTSLATVALTSNTNNNFLFKSSALAFTYAVWSDIMISTFTKRLGLQYTQEQELTADNCAVSLMNFIKVNPTSLSSALSKISDYSKVGNYLITTDGDPYPNIQERIKAIGKSDGFNSISYDKLISAVTSTNAVLEYIKNHYDACNKLIDKNINSGVPTEEDYILKCMVNLCLYDDPEKNNENLTLISMAKKLNTEPSINIYKQEALAYIRLKKYQEALVSLQSYIEKLNGEFNKADGIRNESLWSSKIQYIESELDWTKLMIYKVKNM